MLGVFAVCAAINVMAFCIACFSADEALILHVSVYDAFVVLLPFFSGGFFSHLSVRQTQEENISMFKSMVASVEKQADASKKQADLAQAAAEHAEAEAKIARRDALFSKILAILAIIVALAAPFLSAYATSIVNMLSQMLK